MVVIRAGDAGRAVSGEVSGEDHGAADGRLGKHLAASDPGLDGVEVEAAPVVGVQDLNGTVQWSPTNTAASLPERSSTGATSAPA